MSLWALSMLMPCWKTPGARKALREMFKEALLMGLMSPLTKARTRLHAAPCRGLSAPHLYVRLTRESLQADVECSGLVHGHVARVWRRLTCVDEGEKQRPSLARQRHSLLALTGS